MSDKREPGFFASLFGRISWEPPKWIGRLNEPGTGSDQQQHLWHGSKSETRPKRPGLDRRDEIGGEAAGSEAEVEAAFGEDAALAAKP